MKIGYACKTVGVANTSLKRCLLKNASPENLSQLIAINLDSLENIIDYNIKSKIRLFRISSDLIPFGSNPVNKLSWWELFSDRFQEIGSKIKEHGIRVSMHPGQYTVLNSPNPDVVERSCQDLNYHAQVLESLGVNEENKIILHIGGIYNHKEQAIERFIANYNQLKDSVKKRLVIENDDKAYNIHDLLEIGAKLGIPVIFDNLHNFINPSHKEKDHLFWINECKKTWKEKDGFQKIHYSQQDPLKRTGSHSETIGIDEFIKFYQELKKEDLDIMLEVKDKNLSAIKCINCTSKDKKINVIEAEWSRYKYKVLESSPSAYREIRNLLKNKDGYPGIAFYNLIEDALKMEDNLGNALNAALHIWGYYKDLASEIEKVEFFRKIEEFKQGKGGIKSLKSILWKLAQKYHQEYLLNSYYFLL